MNNRSPKDVSVHEEKQKIYQTIFEHSPLAIMYTDETGTIAICNQRASELFGAPREKLIGFSYTLINNVRMRNAIAHALGGEKSYFEGEYLTVTGNVRTQMRANFSPSFTDQGGVSGVIGVFEDISERVKAERSLRELEERFRLAFLTSPDAININTMDGIYLEINQGFTDLTGYTKEDVIGRSSRDIKIWLIPEDRERLIMGLQNEGFVENLESTFLMKDGSRKIALMSASIINLQDVPHILSVTKDITQLRETEKAHQELQNHLCQVRKLDSVGVLAGGIAHDFNNLLVAILGNIDLALRDLDDPGVAGLLGEARSASIRAKNLTQQLLTFAKGGDPVKKKSSVREIIEDTAGFILRGSKVKCAYRFEEDLPAIDVDSGQISQVVQNIILNAVQAMPEGGSIQMSGESFDNSQGELLTLSRDRYVRIVIIDSGSGIPEEYLEQIFDPYFSTKPLGSGLGLAITYSIITKHGGKIFVASKQGQGTIFTIYLPVIQQNQPVEPKGEPLPRVTVSLTVMVMDDDATVRNVSRRMLESLGHNVLLAADGREAIEIYKKSEKAIDLIIMDLTIPGGMGGKEAVKEILTINPGARVMVSSGYSTDPIMANYQEYGFCFAITKPFELKQLSTILNQFSSKFFSQHKKSSYLCLGST
ncbi:MAG: PAS domain S-box protein [Proteobacteria bacterium]|nr:PAS domain S-box protein [Pseudomonadota bacterium]MBU1686144.1 PAS domain S-box protein [Pseudomonadota bacterium]